MRSLKLLNAELKKSRRSVTVVNHLDISIDGSYIESRAIVGIAINK